MAWKDKLLDASFRGVPFDVQRTADTIEREIAQYAVPHVDGEDIEDLGMKAHDVSVTAIFFGDDYEDRMRALLDALAQKGPGELIHPVFGSLPSMQFISGHVTHDAENVDACSVEMRFKRATPANPFFVEQTPTQTANAAAQVATDAQDAGVNMFEKALDALKTAKAGMRRLNALRDVLADTLGPIRALVSGFRGTTLDYLSFPGAFASDLISLVSSITDFRSFDPGLVMSDWNGMRDQIKTIVKLPAAAASSQQLTVPGTPSASILPIGSAKPINPTTPHTAARSSPTAAHDADVQLITAVTTVVAATVTAGVASEVLENEADTPTLTPGQIEQIVNDARDLLQNAIDEVRAAVSIEQAQPVIESLKDTALAVQTLAIKLIDVLPPIMTRTVSAPSNLTLLAHLWYHDYTRSAELLRLNPQVRNPNFIARGDVLRGFAR